ncbi:hypothetical protein JHK85_007060 [Glycine max]|nr:hypothetical protein JHK85_007060 [Glycine max]
MAQSLDNFEEHTSEQHEDQLGISIDTNYQQQISIKKRQRSSSKDGSKEAQIEPDTIKCNIPPWTHKYRHKLRDTKIPTNVNDQLQGCSFSSKRSLEAWKNELKDAIITDIFNREKVTKEMLLEASHIQFFQNNYSHMAALDYFGVR